MYSKTRSTSVTNHNNGQGIIIGGGNNRPNGANAAGQIQEVIFLNDVEIGENEISQINHYLAEKWLITSTVDSDGDGLMDADDPEPTVSSNLMGENSGLIAYYSFNGNANDSSGNELNGTISGPTLSSDRTGASNKSYSFSGGSSYIEVGDSDLLSSTNSITISAWFKKEPGSNWMSIVQKGTRDSNEEFTLMVKDSSVYFDVGNDGGPYLQQNTILNSNEWYHIVGIHTRTNNLSSLKVYLNGKDVGGSTVNVGNTPNDNNHPMKIGYRFAGSTSQPFNGVIDEFRLYNRSLSSEDVKNLYSEGRQIIVIGDHGHDEVIAIADQAPGTIIIASADEAIKIQKYKKAGIVSQSTQAIENVQDIIKILMTKIFDLRFVNTICYPTKRNQEQIKELASLVDVMIIIGSFTSANSKRLTMLSLNINTNTHQVSGSEEINSSWFENCDSVGISAGASTPDYLIHQVKDKIEKIGLKI